MMMKKGYILASFLFLLISHSVWSQDVVSVNDLLTDSAFVQKLPLPIASITTNVEQTDRLIQETQEKLEITPEELIEVDSILNLLNQDLTSFQNQTTDEFLNTSSAITLDKYRSDIKQIDDRVASYSEIVQTRIQELEVENEKLKDLKTIWEVTLKSDGISELSESIIFKMNGVIQSLDSTHIKVQNSLNYLLELELKLNDLHLGFDNFYNMVSEARDKASKNILIPDSDPIWIMYYEKKDSVDIKTKLHIFVSDRKFVLKEYYQYYKGNIFFAIFILIFIQVLFFAIRYQILRDQIEDRTQKDNTVLRIFKTPFFPALLVGLYIDYLILPQAPLILNKILYLFALIPFIFVLMQVIKGISRFLIFALYLIFSLTIFSTILFDIEILSRSLILVINIVAISWILIVMRTRVKVLDDHPFLRKGIKFFVRASLVVLILCLIGNTFGYYTLTAILLSGILSTVFLSITLYFINLLVIGFFVAIFNSPWGQSYRIIKMYQEDIIVKIERFLIFILTLLYLGGTLQFFYILNDVYGWISGILMTPFNIGNFSFTLNDIFLFILILLITSWISKFIQFILQEQVLFKSKKQRDLTASISSLVKFTIFTVGFVFAALAAGFPFDRITLLISAFGVGIGFGLQNIFNNLVSGIILVFERPLHVGDTIEVGQLIGIVKNIGIRASTIRTFDGAEVIVPNGNLISNELINWTLSDSQRRLIVKVGVAYGTDPNAVIKILLDVAHKNKRLLKDPEPYVLFKEFGDSALGFELRCYTESDDWLIILSDLHVEVNNAILETGIVIPFPQRDLHIKTMDPNIVKAVKPLRGS